MPPVTRNRQIATIKMAQAQLGWDDVFYRSVLAQVTGRASCKVCTATELAKMVRHVETAGFVRKPSASAKTRPTPRPEHVVQVRKVRAILIALGNKPNEYADAILRSQRGVEDAATRYEWATGDELRNLIAALVQQQRRAGSNPPSSHEHNGGLEPALRKPSKANI
jgi:phage gp16-like protein